MAEIPASRADSTCIFSAAERATLRPRGSWRRSCKATNDLRRENRGKTLESLENERDSPKISCFEKENEFPSTSISGFKISGVWLEPFRKANKVKGW